MLKSLAPKLLFANVAIWLVAIVIAVTAIDFEPYFYALQYATLAICVLVGYALLDQAGNKPSIVMLAIIAFMFNPIGRPFDMTTELWIACDVIASVAFLYIWCKHYRKSS